MYQVGFSLHDYRHLAFQVVKTMAVTSTVFMVVALCYTSFVSPVASQEYGSYGIPRFRCRVDEDLGLVIHNAVLTGKSQSNFGAACYSKNDV